MLRTAFLIQYSTAQELQYHTTIMIHDMVYITFLLCYNIKLGHEVNLRLLFPRIASLGRKPLINPRFSFPRIAFLGWKPLGVKVSLSWVGSTRSFFRCNWKLTWAFGSGPNLGLKGLETEFKTKKSSAKISLKIRFNLYRLTKTLDKIWTKL